MAHGWPAEQRGYPTKGGGKGGCKGQGQGRPFQPQPGKGGGRGRAPDLGGAGHHGGASTAKELNTLICQAADRGDLSAILDLVASGHGMNCVNMSTAMHKLARMVKEGGQQVSGRDARLHALSEKVLEELQQQCKGIRVLPRCLSTFAWAYATMNVVGFDTFAVFRLISEAAVPHLHKFKPLELTNLMWGFAKLQYADETLFFEARQRIETDLQEFSSSNLSTLAWTFATTGHHEPVVLNMLAEEFARRLEDTDVKPVELVNMSWSMATSMIKPRPRVLSDLAARIIQRLGRFKAHEVSITAWSFSKLRVRHDNLFAAIATSLSSHIMAWQVHTQGVANVLWAFERQRAMGMDARTLAHVNATVAALIPACWELLPQMKPQEFSCTFRALAKLGIPPGACGELEESFLADAARQGIALLPRFPVQNCLQLLQAFVSLLAATPSILQPEVFEALLSGLVRRASAESINPVLMGKVTDTQARLAALQGEAGAASGAPGSVPLHSSPDGRHGAPGGWADTDYQWNDDDDDSDDFDEAQDTIILDDAEGPMWSPKGCHWGQEQGHGAPVAVPAGEAPRRQQRLTSNGLGQDHVAVPSPCGGAQPPAVENVFNLFQRFHEGNAVMPQDVALPTVAAEPPSGAPEEPAWPAVRVDRSLKIKNTFIDYSSELARPRAFEAYRSEPAQKIVDEYGVPSQLQLKTMLLACLTDESPIQSPVHQPVSDPWQ